MIRYLVTLVLAVACFGAQAERVIVGFDTPAQSVGKRLGKSNIHVIEAGAKAQEVAASMRGTKGVKFAEVDRLVPLNAMPDDPYFGSQWHHFQINSAQAWDTSRGAGVVIGICDTGVTQVPDLPTLLPGKNYVDGSADASDIHGHGTAVAGTAAATYSNALGVAGVAGEASIRPGRVALDSTGYAYWSTMADCIIGQADAGSRVVNLSYAWVGSTAVVSAGQYLKDKGGLLVVAAGNDSAYASTTPTTSLIAVSATADQYDSLASWTNYGEYVRISAPGAGILTTMTSGGFGNWYGTSFASPIVAGAVATLMSARPDLPGSEIEKILLQSADDRGAPGYDIYYGYGRVNVGAAMALAKTWTYTPPVVSPPPPTTTTDPTPTTRKGKGRK